MYFHIKKTKPTKQKKLLSLLTKKKRKKPRSHSWDQQSALGTPHWVTFAPFLTVRNLCYLIFTTAPPHPCQGQRYPPTKVSDTTPFTKGCMPRCSRIRDPSLCVLIFKQFLSFFSSLLFFWLHHAACGILVPQPGIEPGTPALEAGVLTRGLSGRSLSSIFPCVFRRRAERCNRKAWLLTALPRSESLDHEGCLHPLISVSEPPSPHLLNGDICDVPFPPRLLASWAEILHPKSPRDAEPPGVGLSREAQWQGDGMPLALDHWFWVFNSLWKRCLALKCLKETTENKHKRARGSLLSIFVTSFHLKV